MEERKSMGSALVDVFDAGVTLVKSEINALARRVGDIAKAKGIGVVLLLAAVGPLILALVFLILAVFYGLMRLGLGAWAAALLIALLSFGMTGALIFLGLRRLGAEVHTDDPTARRLPMSDDHSDSSRPDSVRPDPARPDPSPAASSAPSAPDDKTPQARKVELRRDASDQAAGENRVLSERPGQATVRVEGGSVTVPVYESQPDGKPEMYSSGLNEKLDAQDDHAAPAPGDPVALRGAPGIPVSTEPTYQDDIRKGEGS